MKSEEAEIRFYTQERRTGSWFFYDEKGILLKQSNTLNIENTI